MNKKKRFIVTGGCTYGVSNHGDDAMLSCLIRGLNKKYKNPEIIFLARHPNKKFDNLFKFKSLKNLDHDHKDLAKNRFFLGMNSNDKTYHLKKISKAMSKADMLIIGGNLFMEVHKNSFLEGVSSYTATLATLARFHSVPVSLFGVNIVDEVENITTMEHARFLIGISNGVSVRESHVIKRLKNMKIKNTKNVKVFGDPAYGMDIKSKGIFSTTNVLKKIKFNIPKKRKIFGINIRYEYFNGFKKHQLDKFFKKMSNLIEKIDNEFNPFFLFIPNCTYKQSNPWHNDELIHKQIIKKVRNKIDFHFVKDNLSVFETLSLFKVVDFHMTNRRHSFIFSSLMHKPSILINGSWADHQIPALKELGLPEQLFDEKKESEKKLIYKIKKTFKNYKKIQLKLKKNITYLRKRSENQVNFITNKI
tara:strand:+ start:1047 stop:2303 length:1257 start_codon:yes stop_codon:yes gene_type:complete